jgi:hypothetical protein
MSPELVHVQVENRTVQFFPLPFYIFLLPCSLSDVDQDVFGTLSEIVGEKSTSAALFVRS